MSAAWTRDEVELIVADYFAMFAAELARRPLNKSEHRQRLKPLLDHRSDASIEFKHANISAVLVNFGLPYIDGYKPRGNYQQLLEQAVLERLAIQPAFIDEAVASPILDPTEPPRTDFGRLDDLEEPPPEAAAAEPEGANREPRARRVDFVRRDAENRRLGGMGEQWALEFERRRLHDRHRRPDLADRVEWVAQTRGDGLGYDIASFNADESPRLIEVKTTGSPKEFPFYVTANEVRVSERHAASYHLYRVFRFAVAPRVFTLQGALSETCRLQATQYSARAGRYGAS
jgi:hypothetical protein